MVTARISKHNLSNKKIDSLKKEFYALDVETTGFNPISDRIVEVAAVHFVDGKKADSFASLVNPKVKIPPAASAVNNITNAMIAASPSEECVYQGLIEFLGEALEGSIIMCAHNAGFDFGFLGNTLTRLGYDGRFEVVDTLQLSRKLIPGLPNYKQGTVGRHFGITNKKAHRAASDAEECGEILCRLLGYR
jgi:DNA polymerase III epsilon subunit family exonuclease